MNTMKVTYLKLKLKADLKADLARPCPRVKFFLFVLHIEICVPRAGSQFLHQLHGHSNA